MAFTIVILEEEKYLKDLLRQKIKGSFPDAYIRDDIKGDDKGLSEFEIVLFDNRRYDAKEENGLYVPIFSSGVIDCKILEDKIRSIIPDIPGERGEMCLLISYAYLDERESYIEREFAHLKNDHDMCIRLDLMSGIRMPSCFTAAPPDTSLTRLLGMAGSDPSFDPELIPSYLTYDNRGFMTPGKPSFPDDVFDMGIDASVALTEKVRELVRRNDRDISALVVTEGFTIRDMARLVPLFDRTEVLLPARFCEEENNLEQMAGVLTRSLPAGQKLDIRYCRKQEKNANVRI